MSLSGNQRGCVLGRWTYGLAAWIVVAPALAPYSWGQQYSSVTVVEPDPEYMVPPPVTPPEQVVVENPADQPTLTAPATEPTSPGPTLSIDALRSLLLHPAATLPAPAVATPPVAAQQVGVPNATESPINESPISQGDGIPDDGKQHFLPLGQPVAKDIVVKEDEGFISLMVRDAPLRQVIALVAETQKLNIVFASPAEVPVTASFDRVPWEKAIEALLSISGHTWTMSEGIIFVTSIESADFVSPQAGGRAVEVFELDFASAVDVDQAVKGILSQAGKSWILESSAEDNRRTREVIAVVDYPANLARISDYVCQVDQPPRQVLIEANILQVQLSDDCKNGINFNNLVRFSGNTIDFRSVGFANSAASSAFFMEVDGGALDGLLELLKTTTDAKALATPKILAVSGQQSHIQIGSQLGFRVTTTTQTGTFESIQFLDVGVVLTVTPRITRDGRVLMRVKPKVSTGQVDAGTGLPSEDTTEVETDILLNNGQGMVIGGLIQETDSNNQTKIPWFGDLPYVGILFTKRQVLKERSEIIVTLVPHVLPYTPMIAEREHGDYARTQERLTEGPLNRVPRPYEARLHDTFTNPRRPIPNLSAIHQAKIAGNVSLPSEEMIMLPPVEEMMEEEMLPEVEGEPMIEFPVEQSSYLVPVQTR